jgi:hypothetical protein
MNAVNAAQAIGTWKNRMRLDWPMNFAASGAYSKAPTITAASHSQRSQEAARAVLFFRGSIRPETASSPRW